jgi:hypothetical protein
MKKSVLISVFLICVILFSGCYASLFAGRKLNRQSESINKCAELLREYGYRDYDSETQNNGNSAWGYPTYVQFWYFQKGSNMIYIAWFSGDVDDKKPMVWGDYLGTELVNKIEALGIRAVRRDGGYYILK